MSPFDITLIEIIAKKIATQFSRQLKPVFHCLLQWLNYESFFKGYTSSVQTIDTLSKVSIRRNTTHTSVSVL